MNSNCEHEMLMYIREKKPDQSLQNPDSTLIVNKVSESVERLIQNNVRLQKRLEKLETDLNKGNTQSAQMDKLVALGSLGAGIAHELNNPLTVVSGEVEEIADLIKEETIDKNAIRFSIDNIKKCADKMRVIVDYIRDYSRKEDDGLWKKININDSINDALTILKPNLESSGVDVSLSLADNLPKIWGHSNKLESVFQNIVGNASDAFIDVSDDRPRKISITSEKDSEGLISVIIRDNAVGMTEEIQKKVFFPFFTTKPKGKGTGLGLSIVADNIKEHKGTVEVRSKLQKGTTFIIKFPVERRGNL